MSETTDKKVVELEFNNAKFKTGIAETLQAIKSLDDNLKFKNGAEGLKNITVASSKVDFGDIIKGADEVGGRLSGLKSIAEKAFGGIQSIAGTFMKGAGIAGVLTSLPVVGQSISGGLSRAQKLAQAKFTMEGLGVEWKDIYKDIDNSVKGTAYGLDQAASAASQLVSSGVQIGDQMETVLKSIAGLAAMTGSDYDSIANVMTAVAGQGKLMTMQLRQLEWKGFNAAAALKNYMAQFEGFEDITEEEVRDMVEKGNISFDLFSSAMSVYADQAAKANNTFSGAMSNIKAALSRTTADFFEEVMGMAGVVPVLNDIRLLINGINEATNSLMHNKVDEETKEIIERGVVIQGVINTLNQVHEAFQNTVLKTETNANGVEINRYFRRWQQTFETMAPVISGFFEYFNSGVYNITSAILNMGSVFAEVLRIVFTFLNPVGQAFNEVFGTSFKDVTEALNEGTLSLVDFLAAIKPTEDQLNTIKTVSIGLLSVVKTISSFIGGVFSAAFKTFTTIGMVAVGVLKTLYDGFSGIVGLIVDVGSKVLNFLGDFFKPLINLGSGVGSRIESFFAPINEFISNLTKGDPKTAIEGFFGSMNSALESYDPSSFLGLFSDIGSGISDFFSPVGAYLSSGFESIMGFFGGIDLQSIAGNVGNIFGQIGNSIIGIFGVEQAFADTGEAIDDTSKSADDLGNRLKTLAEIGRDSILHGLGEAFSFIGDRLSEVYNFIAPKIELAKEIISSLFDIIKSSVEEAGITLEPVVKLIDGFKETFSKMMKNFSEKGFSIETVFGFFSDLSGMLGGFVNDTGPKVENAISNIGSVLSEQTEGPLADLYNMITTIGTVLNGLPGLIENIPNAIGEALGGLSSLIRNPFATEKTDIDESLPAGIQNMANTSFDLVESTRTIAKAMKDPLETSKNFFTESFSGAMEAIGNSIDEGINSINFENIRSFILEVGSIGALAGSIWSLYEFASLLDKAKGFIGSLSGTFDAIIKMLETIDSTIKDVGKSIKTEARANAFLKYTLGFASSVLILAGAIYLISTIDTGKLWQSVAVVAILMGVMAALVALFSFLNGNKMKEIFSQDGNGGAIGSIIAMSVAMLLIGRAVQNLGSMDEGELNRGMQAAILLLVILGVMSSMANVTSGMASIEGAAGIIAMAGGLVLLAYAIQMLSAMDWNTFGNGLLKSAILMGVLIGAIKLLNLASKDMVNVAPTLIGLAISMGAFALAIGLLNNIIGDNYGTTFASLVVLCVGILALGKAISFLSGFEGSMIKGGASISIMAAAMIEMAIALGILNLATGGNILQMALELGVLIGALFLMSKILTGMGALAPTTTAAALSLLIMTGALAGFVAVIALLGILPIGVIVQGIISMVLALALFGGMAFILAQFSGAITALGISLSTLGFAVALITLSFVAFGAALAFLSTMAPATFANIADGIVAFCDRIAASGDTIVATAQIIGEAVAASISAFFGRLINDIGAGISTLAGTVQGKQGEIFNAAKSLGSSLISGIIGGLVGIGEAVIGAITGPISDAISGSTKTMSDAGAAYSQEYVSGMLENPDQYVQAGEQAQEYANEGLESGDPGTEAGRMAGENYATAAGDEIKEKLPNEVDPDEILTKVTENADPEAATQWLTSMFGDSFSSEEVTSSIGAYGGSLIDTLSSGLLDGASQNQIDPMQLMTSLGIGGGALDFQSMEAGKGVGIAVSNGAAISLADNSPIESGVTAQLDAITAHTGDFESAGQANGSAYATGLNDQLASIDVSGSVSAVNNSLTSTIPVAQEAGTQTGQAYGTAQIAAISEMTSLISATITENLYSAAAQADANGAGNQTGSKFGDGSSQGISAKASSITMTVANAMMQAASNSDPGGKGYQAGTWFGNGAQSGVSDSVGGMSGTVGTAFENASRDSDPGGKGYQAGEWFARGMADGIRMYASNVADEAAKMVRDAKEAANREQGAKSPAKEMIKSGHWFDEGMRIGIKEYSSRVSDAAGSMTGDAMDSASSAFSLMGSLVDTIDWDSNPTITPVLDLDQFRSDAASMSGFMPDSQVVSASYAGRIDAVRGEALSAQNAANQNNNTIYITLDWKAGTTPNQMVQQIADGLQTLNLTKGR